MSCISLRPPTSKNAYLAAIATPPRTRNLGNHQNRVETGLGLGSLPAQAERSPVWESFLMGGNPKKRGVVGGLGALRIWV